MKISAVNKINIKTTITFLFFLSLIVLTAFIFKYNFVSAGAGESVQGFVWGGTQSLGGYQGFGWISLNNITDGSAINYGVNVPVSDGNLSGFAWSEHYGWISFNDTDLVGCAPVLTQAKITGSNVTGGARILAIKNAGGNAGGFDGCISLSGSSYGVTAVDSGLGYKLLQGYAWSSDLGWIDFNISGSPMPVSVAAPTGFVATPGACNSSVINLSWNSVAGATSYTLKDGATIIYTGIATSFSHNPVVNDGATHSYTVMATKGSDNSALTAASAVAPISCSAVPAVPSITATPGACDSGTITVNWSSSGATKYTVKDGATTLLTDTSLTSKSFTGLPAGFTHSYTVMATNLNGSSAYSTPQNIAAPDACGAASPSATLVGSGCDILNGFDNCNGQFTWEIKDYLGTPNLYNQTRSLAYLPNDSVGNNVSKNLYYGTNRVQARDGSTVLAGVDVVAKCISGTVWGGSTCIPGGGVAPTIMSVTATPKLIRSGQTSTITAVVTSSEPSRCEFKGAESTVQTRDYGIGTESKSVDTRELTSAQIVEVQCYPISDSSIKTPIEQVRVSIVPEVQEI